MFFKPFLYDFEMIFISVPRGRGGGALVVIFVFTPAMCHCSMRSCGCVLPLLQKPPHPPPPAAAAAPPAALSIPSPSVSTGPPAAPPKPKLPGERTSVCFSLSSGCDV